MRDPIDPKTGLPIPSRTDQQPRRRRRGRVPGPGDIAKVDAEVLRDPGLHATPEDFGAGVGDALADFAAGAGRVASDFAEMRREAEDDTAAAAGLSEARVRFTRVAESMKTQAMTTEGLTGNLGTVLGKETDAILRDLREVRGLRPSKGGGDLRPGARLREAALRPKASRLREARFGGRRKVGRRAGAPASRLRAEAPFGAQARSRTEGRSLPPSAAAAPLLRRTGRRRQAPGWRRAVDDHYASLAPALETMDPDGRARFEDDYARTTGVLPGAVAKQLRAGLLSAEPAGQAAVASAAPWRS